MRKIKKNALSQKIRVMLPFVCTFLMSGCGGGSGSGSGGDTGINAGALNWEDSIVFCEDLEFAGYTDWRLPNIKELHSIVDYTRSPDATGSAAIDSVFHATEITNEGGELDYPYYWSSTTHKSENGSFKWATYIAFGRALGYLNEEWKDVHGAGSQRSDPKEDNGRDYSKGFGPQGDAVRIVNYARCVRDDGTITSTSYTIVDTDQDDNTTTTFGEDSDYHRLQPNYTLNVAGTIVTDNNTGLMWQKTMGEKTGYANALGTANNLNLGGYADWRVPTVKELYTLILFSGEDATSCTITNDCKTKKFIDTDFFEQPYGDNSDGERVIDAQTWTSTEYVSTTMDGDETSFGINFVDGRIKGYPVTRKSSNSPNVLYVRYVRGDADYEDISYTDNSDDTITDNRTGLMWTKGDSGSI